MSQLHTDRERLEAAIGWRKVVWRSAFKTEDERLEKLRSICTQLCDGDSVKGEALARAALWTPADDWSPGMIETLAALRHFQE